MCAFECISQTAVQSSNYKVSKTSIAFGWIQEGRYLGRYLSSFYAQGGCYNTRCSLSCSLNSPRIVQWPIHLDTMAFLEDGRRGT